MNNPIPIAVSSCLLGNNVRFNGANSHKKMITEELATLFDFHPICPEMFAGLGVPRKPIFLEKNSDDKIRVRQHETNKDLTDKLVVSAKSLIQKLPEVYGFILKKSSPSCGNGTVKLFTESHDMIHNKADGVFLSVLKEAKPLIPIEDEGRLNDPGLKEHFIKRVLLTYEVTELVKNCQSVSQLITFHTRHKMILRLHHPVNQKALGRLVASADTADLSQVLKEYYSLFLLSFQKVAKRGNHFTILQRILREINRLITKAEKENLQQKITAYRDGLLPLSVPVEMIKHYLIRYDIDFLKQQSYLNLYPENLGLMNFI
ncbi:DUF523 and DUF1722 domain-containing protein [Thiotrichales bacterium 19S11-10]|nr:DUF523 and DUF1722 domain-containing protein [Thiotrichales bacterium 19S11-10]